MYSEKKIKLLSGNNYSVCINVKFHHMINKKRLDEFRIKFTVLLIIKFLKKSFIFFE